ncbi:7,8-didemethyl-8-hydroxy-5-deazariboflavin synthase subunit CofG [Roseofilum casamattae]|uniref:7,8-didemethyl-8-hydroxy-5-deazariboflavin synthase n=1 Tax=Roseofilum casamattae BLCC-M143 TaxID=3022442 RepID=A0ABT7C0I3_9CYAN|nr:7,8-didemethyl-8-hydroxy-5-deazariboflavin synthase subunit CofG [Roseofilum casamattae]MDJ1184191.1 7,8-didemethyl-8-hydroxy-5-deazariboflavin synthase subunit CofG [Roseofilum casamattae BLCC-M143]
MYRNVTYSPAYTLVPTYECFNQCSYCNFRVAPGEDKWLSTNEATERLQVLLGKGICEILILSGEVHPRSDRRQAWFNLIYNVCERSLSFGFLPHTNVGLLSWEEMEKLKQVNVSMGLMLEQLTPRLLQTVHTRAPSKQPKLRLQQLEWAGQLQIPFTTGILLGIGETEEERSQSLAAISKIHQRYGHIQEVILQPHSLGSQQALPLPRFDLHQLPDIIGQARAILPADIALQIPPNLVNYPDLLLACLEAGATDLGGLGPKDEVNPDYPHPVPEQLRSLLEPAGWSLSPRLPVYPQFDHWVCDRLISPVQHWRDFFAQIPS